MHIYLGFFPLQVRISTLFHGGHFYPLNSNIDELVRYAILQATFKHIEKVKLCHIVVSQMNTQVRLRLKFLDN